MVEISLKSLDKINNSTSKGDQIKEKIDDVWYKIDSLGYEGLSEAIVSSLLSHSNAYSYVNYDESNIRYKGIILNGCKSNNFLPDGSEMITAYRLFMSNYGQSPSQIIKEDSVENSIYHFVSALSRITKMSEEELGKKLTQIIELDALTLNDDRHFNNIPFILFEDGHFELGPIFDNGSSLLSDTTFQPIGNNSREEIEDYILLKEAKPFSSVFEEQVWAARKLFGSQLILDVAINELIPRTSIYEDEILKRCQTVLELQFDRYPELFKLEKEIVYEKQYRDCNYKVVYTKGLFLPLINDRIINDKNLKNKHDKAYIALQRIRQSLPINKGNPSHVDD